MSNKRKIDPHPILNGYSALDPRPGADKVAKFNYPGPGAINVYICRDCSKLTVVQHIDKGVTPAFLACRASEGCLGQAQTARYPDQNNIPPRVVAAVRWEWYRPSVEEFMTLDTETQEHVSRGGLVLREKELEEDDVDS